MLLIVMRRCRKLNPTSSAGRRRWEWLFARSFRSFVQLVFDPDGGHHVMVVSPVIAIPWRRRRDALEGLSAEARAGNGVGVYEGGGYIRSICHSCRHGMPNIKADVTVLLVAKVCG